MSSSSSDLFKKNRQSPSLFGDLEDDSDFQDEFEITPNQEHYSSYLKEQQSNKRDSSIATLETGNTVGESSNVFKFDNLMSSCNYNLFNENPSMFQLGKVIEIPATSYMLHHQQVLEYPPNMIEIEQGNVIADSLD